KRCECMTSNTTFTVSRCRTFTGAHVMGHCHGAGHLQVHLSWDTVTVQDIYRCTCHVTLSRCRTFTGALVMG
ncbi:hypothetical protein LSAT2_018698, partial [Lamellibrachia satsuma]